MIYLTAQELNQAICKKYNLKHFNCLYALFGVLEAKQPYLITITAEKLKQLKELQAEFFESYVGDSITVYEYLLSAGYEGDIYIK